MNARRWMLERQKEREDQALQDVSEFNPAMQVALTGMSERSADEKRLHEEGAVVVLIDTPIGIPRVRNPFNRKKLGSKLFKKLPGGKRKPGESAREAAIRELIEEVFGEVPAGLTPEALVHVAYEDRITHDWDLFYLKLSDIPVLKEVGDEDEEVMIDSAHEILEDSDYFPQHRIVSEDLLRQLCAETN